MIFFISSTLHFDHLCGGWKSNSGENCLRVEIEVTSVQLRSKSLEDSVNSIILKDFERSPITGYPSSICARVVGHTDWFITDFDGLKNFHI